MNPPTKTTPDTRYRVLRGGCWYFAVPAGVRATFRYSFAPTYRNNDLGFRCALRVRSPRV